MVWREGLADGQLHPGRQVGAGRNFERWDILGEYVWPNAGGCEERDTYAKEVEYLAWWLERRLDWMDGAVEELLDN